MKGPAPAAILVVRMLLKADFHIHTREDPHDFIRYTAVELLQEAARQGFQVLALTCHNKRIHTEELRRRAEDLGILLIPGVEAAIEGKHTLLLDMPYSRLRVRNFKHVRRHASRTAASSSRPIPFFPAPSASTASCARTSTCSTPSSSRTSTRGRFDFNQQGDRIRAAHGHPARRHLRLPPDLAAGDDLHADRRRREDDPRRLRGHPGRPGAGGDRAPAPPGRIREKWDGARPLRRAGGLRPGELDRRPDGAAKHAVERSRAAARLSRRCRCFGLPTRLLRSIE